MSGWLRSVLTLLLAGALSGQQPGATIIFSNGKIWTGNTQQPEAQSVAVLGDRIVAVGSDADVAAWKGPGTVNYNLEGRRMLPGFYDGHVHLLMGGRNLSGPQLRYTKSQADFRDTLAEYARRRPQGEWITGGNWDHENWTPAQLPNRQLIDAATGGRPVLLSRLDGHMALANSRALELAGVTRATKDVPGGVIVRDASGNPTGILKDAAMNLVSRVIPAPTEQQMREAVRAAQTYANAQGVTSVEDMSAWQDAFRTYQQMALNGELHLRISGHQPLTTWQRLASLGMQARFGSTQLQMGALKGFADGSLGSTTALLFAPYLDAPQTSGIPSAELADAEGMYRNIREADKAGLQIAIHAIGDRANNTILNMFDRAMKENGARDRRFRIEHAQHLLAGDIPRFGKAGVIASMQPLHLADDGRWAEKRIGPERARTAYAFRALLDSGATLAFGSDWDVAPMSPLRGIAAAVTRQTLDGKHPDGWIPEQKITVAEAVRAYTYGSAYAAFQEKEKGTIEAGKLADLIVLSDDIFTMEPSRINDTKVDLTVFGGRIIAGPEQHYDKLPSGLLLRQ